jgi:hypothetical protein
MGSVATGKLVGLGMDANLAAVIDNRFDSLGTRTIFVPAGIGKAGATAGWTTANNTGNAQLPASQTGSTFTLPITGLSLGDVISAYRVVGQIESAGGAVTLDADLRKLTNAAADPTDASLGAITQIAVSADNAFSSSKTLTAAETLATGEMIYLRVTATTAASTDIQFAGVEVTVASNQAD